VDLGEATTLADEVTIATKTRAIRKSFMLALFCK